MAIEAPTSEYARALAENERYAAQFDHSALPLPPGRKLAVLACMDARLTVEDVLGLRTGDAHIIRNAGGSRPTTRSARSSSARTCSAPRRSSSSSTPAAGCSRSRTTTSTRDLVARDRRRRRPRVPCLPEPRGQPARAGSPNPSPPVGQGRAGPRPRLRGRDGPAPGGVLKPGCPAGGRRDRRGALHSLPGDQRGRASGACPRAASRRPSRSGAAASPRTWRR